MIDFEAFANAYYIQPDVELGFIVNLKTLRWVLMDLHVKGRRWWIATDPHQAVGNGYIRIFHGDENCVNALNTQSFRIPVMNEEVPRSGADHVLLLIAESSITPEDTAIYSHDRATRQDGLDDLALFFVPIKLALIQAMQT